jgi:hypothetical protein
LFRGQHLQEYITNELFTTLLRAVCCKHTHPGVDHGRCYLLLIKHSPSSYQRQRIAIYREANPTGNDPVSLLSGRSVEPLLSNTESKAARERESPTMAYQIKPRSSELLSDDSGLSSAGFRFVVGTPALIVQFLDLAQPLQHGTKMRPFSISRRRVPVAAQVIAPAGSRPRTRPRSSRRGPDHKPNHPPPR